MIQDINKQKKQKIQSKVDSGLQDSLYERISKIKTNKELLETVDGDIANINKFVDDFCKKKLEKI
jgi:hypothetical protein